jgi:hypothetical protein
LIAVRSGRVDEAVGAMRAVRGNLLEPEDVRRIDEHIVLTYPAPSKHCGGSMRWPGNKPEVLICKACGGQNP